MVKATYDQEYEELIHKEGVPFAPNVIGKDLMFSAAVILGILVCALVFGPKGPTGPPDPTLIITAPKPDYYFLPVFAGLALLPAYTETVLLLTLPVVIIVLSSGAAVHFQHRREELAQTAVLRTAGGRNHGDAFPARAIRTYFALVAKHVGLEWRPDSHASTWPDAVRWKCMGPL